jgi:hypothetical protein|tara:strand:+ start:165 stop:596 length:432 start_codon:yes stop_codon:yes gene_type:complete
LKRTLPTCLVISILLVTGCPLLYAGETPSVEGTQVYFINLKDGDQVQSPFLVQLGLTEQMGLAPAAADWPDTGHHHLVIDTPTPNPNKSIPKGENYIHLNMGQSEITIELPPGEHTLQAVLADYAHVIHDGPVVSDVITITVK